MSGVKVRGSTPEVHWKLAILSSGEEGRIPGVGVKSRGSTSELPLILIVLSPREVSGIPSVEVKFVDIRKNTSGEGGPLERN